MDYQALWERLRNEVRYLAQLEVKSIDPHVVIAYMEFLEEIERLKHEQSDKG